MLLFSWWCFGGYFEPWLIFSWNSLDHNGNLKYYELFETWGMNFLFFIALILLIPLLSHSLRLIVQEGPRLMILPRSFPKIHWHQVRVPLRSSFSFKRSALVGRRLSISTRRSWRLWSTRTVLSSMDTWFSKTCDGVSISLTIPFYSLRRVAKGFTDSPPNRGKVSLLAPAGSYGLKGIQRSGFGCMFD